MNLFSLALYFLPFVFSFTVAYFVRGTIKDKFISLLLLALALFSLYKAFEAGMNLKNSEVYFARNDYGKSAKYTEHEKHVKIKELKSRQKNREATFTLFSILYWISTLGITVGTFRVLKKHKKKKLISPPIITNNSCSNGSI